MREIEFDTDGITTECPAEPGGVTSDECFGCIWHWGHKGFIVECSYPEDEQPEPAELEKAPV